jgi:pyruvate/2-oxoglutarate dehydrogenase complex dihydrolipoamide dehydrogenase (E3) component
MLLFRHLPREHPFDFAPGWLGHRVDELGREADYRRRRLTLEASRYRGSVPPEIAQDLYHEVACGRLRVRTGEVIRARTGSDGGGILTLAGDNDVIHVDRVVLATGFHPDRPGGAWLTRVIADLGLACAECGYPIVDRELRWHRGIYVTGALAELELGPAARNFIGARLAAERLVSAT